VLLFFLSSSGNVPTYNNPFTGNIDLHINMEANNQLPGDAKLNKACMQDKGIIDLFL
jgi:hypothetical protein